MSQLGFYYDIDRCTGCKTCQIACKDVNDNEVGVLFREVLSFENDTFPNTKAYSVSMSCNHCEMPYCLANCPATAISKQEDGRVIIDQEVCIGCQTCVNVCPYGAPSYIPERKVSGKCDLCLALVQNGEQPACVASCLMRAIEWGDISELRSKHSNNADIVGIPSSEQTNPNVTFKLHRSLL
ncbi:MAG: 4Fe-4S dicluster domain-containing protein [Coriobacteriales bacterium]|jgi:anaerobic dimethyl sulfoxide reductase subunit B (iron-sulfur subunit)|nr:4Fe-4S dicluster domain-containing protein [Coriobacteriales bacterium]